jgi:plastocyanin
VSLFRTSPAARRAARGLVALAAALALLTACGGGETGNAEAPEAPSGDAETITATEADFSISLDEDSLTAGTYEIEVVNEGGATHDLVVERDGEDVAASDSIAPGESTTVTVELEAGDYVFYCSIGNHREMGMEIQVSVT